MPKFTDLIYPTPLQPRQLRIDSTSKCNAQCSTCHRFLSNRKGEMDVTLIVKILDDVARWEKSLDEIVPIGYGEFFMRKDWAWILGMIASKLPKTRIVIPTNGSLLDSEKVDILCQIPTLKVINFSINALFDETYESFMGLPSSNIPKIKGLMEEIKISRPDILVRASMVFDPKYQTDIERDAFMASWEKIADVQIMAAASAGRRENKPYQRVKLPCRSLFADIVIGYDEKLSSCCFDAGFRLDLGKYSGNLKKDWLNPKLEAFRKLHNEHRRQESDLCKVCSSA